MGAAQFLAPREENGWLPTFQLRQGYAGQAGRRFSGHAAKRRRPEVGGLPRSGFGHDKAQKIPGLRREAPARRSAQWR